MMVQEHHLLTAFVQRVQRGLTLRRLLQGGIVLLTVCLTVLLLGVGVQYIVPFVPLVAPLYSLLALGILVYLGLYIVLPALRPVSLPQALTSIEETYPDLHDDLTNAVQLNPEVLERSNPTVWPLTWCRRCTIVRHGRCSSTAYPMSCVEAGCWVSRGALWWDWPQCSWLSCSHTCSGNRCVSSCDPSAICRRVRSISL